MQIVVNTDEALSDLDKEILGLVLGDAPAAKSAGTRSTAKKTAAAPPKEEDLLGGDTEPSMDDVVARATEIINAKKQADLKKILTSLGYAKVGEIKPKDFAAFLEDASSVDTD